MDKPDLILSVGGVAIPVGALFVWLAKNAVATLLKQHEQIMAMKLKAVGDQIDDLETRIQHMNLTMQDKLLPAMESLKEAVIRNSARQEAMKEQLERHAAQLEVMLPAIRTEIGKLSMYWKKKTGSDGE